MSDATSPAIRPRLEPDHLEDIKLAATKMLGAKRRAFQAAMAQKYCGGSARPAEKVFGWNRQAVQLGLHEARTGIVCLSAQSTFAGDKLWEEKHPDVANALWALAQEHAQQDPTFRTTLAFTRLTAKEALERLRAQGFADEVLPASSTMAAILNRNGYRLRPVVKAKPQKKMGLPRNLWVEERSPRRCWPVDLWITSLLPTVPTGPCCGYVDNLPVAHIPTAQRIF